MEYILVCSVAFLASGLTFFSGFGLGTILMPAFALFFPVPVAVGATAIVHLANNIFKLFLIGPKADKEVVLRFGIPAVFAALVGAFLLTYVSLLPVLASYQLGGHVHEVTLVKLVIGVIIIFFACLELIPGFAAASINRKYMAVGGLLSGFFGGLSGNQGAFRSMFLIKAGLNKEAFIGSNVVIAVLVDLARLTIYGAGLYAVYAGVFEASGALLAAATVSAFLGAFLGKRLLKKVTLETVRAVVGLLLIVLGLGLSTGLI